jgi:hypothetical protein
MDASGTVSVATNGTNSGVSRLATTPTIAGRFDLNDNDLVVDYTGTTVLPTIQALTASGRNDGAWNGVGINSSEAASHPAGATALGVAEASDVLGATGGVFSGQSVDGTTVLVKYTWYGDADFNGIVDFDDYVRTDGGFNFGLTGWINGDFDLNGSIDFDDYVLIDLGFNAQSGTLRRAQDYLSGDDRSMGGMNGHPALQMVVEHFNRFGNDYGSNFLAAVPEPAPVAIFTGGVTLVTLLRRRKRDSTELVVDVKRF